VAVVLSQARFMDQQEAYRGARSPHVRAQRLLLICGGRGHWRARRPRRGWGPGFTIRVPYAWGIMCSTTVRLRR